MDRPYYSTPLLEIPDAETGLTPLEEQMETNRRLAAWLDRLAAELPTRERGGTTT